MPVGWKELQGLEITALNLALNDDDDCLITPIGYAPNLPQPLSEL